MDDRRRGPWRSRSVTITSSLGLHARPAAGFVKLAESFDAEIEVASKGGRVSAKSIMGLMMLAAGTGVELTVSARGPDAAIALEALVRFVDCGFVGDCRR